VGVGEKRSDGGGTEEEEIVGAGYIATRTQRSPPYPGERGDLTTSASLAFKDVRVQCPQI
jgi:hypothetical protein